MVGPTPVLHLASVIKSTKRRKQLSATGRLEAFHSDILAGTVTSAKFRDALQAITDAGHAHWWPDRVAELREQYSHSVRDACLPFDQRWNCFAYALGLMESGKYLRVKNENILDVFANTFFVQYLIAKLVLTPSGCDGDAERLVIYFPDGEPVHAGILRAGRVTSKWGSGPCFEHELLEVPSSYGSEVACYEIPNPLEIERAFLDFAESMGVNLSELFDDGTK